MAINKNVLVVAPHQDDEVIGCGGTIALFAESGYNIFVVHVYRGSSGVRNKKNNQAQALRQKEALQASRIINFKLLKNLAFEDRNEDETINIQNSLISIIRKVKPSIVFAPHENERDFEHRVVNKATLEASWLAATDNFKELGTKSPKIVAIFGYEVWTPIQRPNFYIDITKYVHQKKIALEKYPSQMASTSWLEGALGLNSYRGTTFYGRNYAEAFEVNSSDISEFTKTLKDLNTS